MDRATVPDELEVTGATESGIVMALREDVGLSVILTVSIPAAAVTLAERLLAEQGTGALPPEHR